VQAGDVEEKEPTEGNPEEAESDECVVCRGKKTVQSNLGGETSVVDCPWCEGTGKKIADHNAQSKWPTNEDKTQAE